MIGNKYITAVHEAGHALAAWVYSSPFDYIAIGGEVNGEKVSGYMLQPEIKFFSDKNHMTRYINAEAYAAAGGPIAHEIYLKSVGIDCSCRNLWSDTDYEALCRYSKSPSSFCASTHPVSIVVRELFDREGIMPAVIALAEVLFDKGKLYPDEAIMIMRNSVKCKPKGNSARGYILEQSRIMRQAARYAA